MAAAAGTWAFSFPALQRMKGLLLQGVLATDCLEEAMADIENDEVTGSFVVGRGGYPNKDGIIQCDGAIMEGQPGRFGAVAALHGIGTPLAVARKVMEESPHSFLVGDGAVAFAKDQGFTVEDNGSMMSTHSTEAYQEYLEKGKTVKKHDTLAQGCNKAKSFLMQRLKDVEMQSQTAGSKVFQPNNIYIFFIPA